MRIEQVTVRSFRNLRAVQVVPSSHLNWFFGANGQGKTNLLEAIYVALRGKSFRPYSSKADWIPVGSDVEGSPSVALRVLNERGYDLDLRLVYGSSEKWDYYLDDKRISVARVRSLVPVVAFSPDDHALVRWEPELRRGFLDEMLTDVCPGYAESLERYQSALKNRNRLLKTMERSAGQACGELEAWTEALAKCGIELLQFRHEMWDGFDRHFAEIAPNLFDQSALANLRLSYAPDYRGLLRLEGMLEHLQKSLNTDIATGWTHRGPHRDDFHIFMDGIDSRSGASQGQSRMIALALKWTHAHWVRDERGEIPIFLVDDFSSELDVSRRKSLLSFLSESKGQVLITGTDETLIDSQSISDYNLYSVHGGIVTRKTVERVGEINV